ncbi:MAG: N-acetyl-alpha-D-glucosaminyl L-malate synthase BshA [Myxococcota bacterium]
MSSPLKIGIVCYPTIGGSGVAATEIGLEMARRGHQVHFISEGRPGRLMQLEDGGDNVRFHEVEPRDYPLFTHRPYTLALASKLVEVTEFEQLDVLHVHYAVPHAASAWMACQILGDHAPRLVATLHGTDVTVVGADPCYRPVTRFAIEQCDAVTVPSEFLRDYAREHLGLSGVSIEVLPNFVDTERWCPAEPPVQQPLILAHVSNFRSVKRVDDVVEVFLRLAPRLPVSLLMIGDGPDRSQAERAVRNAGLADRACFLGKRDDFVHYLQKATVFLLPSASESFGLAALEAQSCGIPVVATRVGGIPEVIQHGETGLLAPVGDLDQLTTLTERLLTEPETHRAMSQAARVRAQALFDRSVLAGRYEALYRA